VCARQPAPASLRRGVERDVEPPFGDLDRPAVGRGIACGVVLGNRGDYRAAEVLVRRGLDIRRIIYKEPHEDLGYSLNNLAVNLYQQGEDLRDCS